MAWQRGIATELLNGQFGDTWPYKFGQMDRARSDNDNHIDNHTPYSHTDNIRRSVVAVVESERNTRS